MSQLGAGRWTPPILVPSRKVTKTVTTLFVVKALLTLAGVTGSAATMAQLRDRDGAVDVRASSEPDWVRVIGILGLPLTVLLVVMFLVWFHRTFRSALAHEGDTGGGAGILTALWLVPVVNLIACFGTVAKIWDAGRPAGASADRRGLLLTWWIAGCGAVGIPLLSFGIGIAKALSAVGAAVDAAQRGEQPAATVAMQSASSLRRLELLSLAGAHLSAAAALSAAAFVLVSSHRLGIRSRTGARLAALPARVVALAVAVAVLALGGVAVLAGS